MVLEHDPKISDPPTHWPEKNHWHLDSMREFTDLTEFILENWTIKMTEALNKAHTSSHVLNSPAAPIGIKLDGSNYALWS